MFERGNGQAAKLSRYGFMLIVESTEAPTVEQLEEIFEVYLESDPESPIEAIYIESLGTMQYEPPEGPKRKES